MQLWGREPKISCGYTEFYSIFQLHRNGFVFLARVKQPLAQEVIPRGNSSALDYSVAQHKEYKNIKKPYIHL
jgi:hypothetical protein